MRKIQIAGCPKRRDSGVVSQEFDAEDGTIVLDLASSTAHRLEPVAASIWSLCDGSHSVTEIATGAHTTVALVEETLDNLDALGLLEQEEHGLTRRKILVRGAQVGALTAVAFPLIESQAMATPPGVFSTGHMVTFTSSGYTASTAAGTNVASYTGDSGLGTGMLAVSTGSNYNYYIYGTSPDVYAFGSGMGATSGKTYYIGVVLNQNGFNLENASGISISYSTDGTNYTALANSPGVNNTVDGNFLTANQKLYLKY